MQQGLLKVLRQILQEQKNEIGKRRRKNIRHSFIDGGIPPHQGGRLVLRFILSQPNDAGVQLRNH